MRMAKASAFDILVNELQQSADVDMLLKESMTLDPRKVQRIPIRYRIIALGFVKRFTLDALNEKLLSAGCAQLYARSTTEASLIYAFHNGLSYPEWRQLLRQCESLLETRTLENRFFRNRTISMQDLTDYLEANSRETGPALETAQLTQRMQRRLLEIAGGAGSFEAFLEDNLRAFSPVREKTRYYFCKYLYYDLLTKIEDFLSAVQYGPVSEDTYAMLTMFKGVQTLKRRKMTPNEIREFLMQTDISCGGIFDAFNYHYFEYVSSDWMDVLIEYCGSLESLPEKDRKRLADSLRKSDPKAFANRSDAEILRQKQAEAEAREEEMDRIYALEGSDRGYQRNRSGENAIRKYIKGELDLDRTTLIAFLLFFGNDSDLSAENAICEERLSAVLRSCGFPPLRPEDDFDSFVLGYLEADDPTEFLMEEVTNRALEEENFYLYRVYNLSSSYHEDLEKLVNDTRSKT